MPYANTNITAEQILMPTQIELSHSIYISSACNTSLRVSSTAGNRHFFLSDGAFLRLEGLTMKGGFTGEIEGGGGSIFENNAEIDAVAALEMKD